MNSVLSRLWAVFWRLLPANPILVRVVYGQSRRVRHLWLRFGYLAVLLAVVMISLLSESTTGSLSDLAKGASRTFWFASVTQLALMCFLAPIFTAGAITQEKDAQTYNILISTPLSNAQIVVGSLMSRLYFVIVLLLAALPIFFTTMIYGGVTASQIYRSFAIAGSTAILTGSLAITISMIRVGTRRTIFSFFLAIGLYLFAVWGLGLWSRTHIPEAPLSPSGERLSWLAAFHPFLAMQVALNQIEPPDVAAVAHYGRLGRYYIAYPHTAYVATTLALSTLLIIVSIFFARRTTRQGEQTFWSRITDRLPRLRRGPDTRKPHDVWANPVAWREAVTRASAVSRGLGRYLILGCGLVAALVLLVYHLRGGAFTTAMTQQWLWGMVAVEFGLVLIIATNTAATALTREKESKTMDILLTTPLTSGYIIWGKLRGLVSFVAPMIAVPVLSLLIFGVVDAVRRASPVVVAIEAWLELAALLVVFSAYACLLGLQFSLKQRKTVRAVTLAVGVLVVVNLAVFAFWSQVVESTRLLGVTLSPATPFTAIRALIEPSYILDPQELTRKWSSFRVAAATGTCMFLLVHGLIAYSWYKWMVKGFDMIIRKQSGQF